MDTWNELPDNLKKALMDAAEDYYNILLESYVGEMKKVYELVEKGKVIRCVLDDACEKKHAEAAYKLWDEIAARDAAAAKGIQLIKEWRKTLK
jgi:TRAP-type mannitol/chloroaromatic compound transport system substrate-binding protein